MGQKLDILMLEDVASDAEIVEYDLRKAKIEFTYRRVDTREDFLKELERKIPDLILADYSLPNFDGLTALGLAREICPETPFIFVSGAMGEEVAIDTLQKGATDYVLKQRLERLGPAVERALREAEERRQRRAAEEKLRESEELFRTLFQTAGSFISVASPEGRILEFNPEAERVTGWQRQEVLGQDLFRLFVPEEYREAVQADIKKVLAGQLTRGFEMPLKLRHGGDLQFLWNINRLLGQDGQVIGVMAVGQDITERQLAAEALGKSAQKLRILTSQVLTAQEKERKRISRELHDELGQALMLLKLNLRAADRQLPEASEVKAELRGMSLYLDEVIDKVRRLSRDLSPAILEDLGLVPALHYLIDEYSKHYQITHAFDLQELDHLFTKEAQIILYRIFQEALTNIARHAGATDVRLAIRKVADAVIFEVEDNGQGFDVARALGRPSREKGLGLAALDERAKMLGGALAIQSLEGTGTRLALIIPVVPKND